jgi:hypothetical protein
MSTNRTLIGGLPIGSQYLDSLAVQPRAVWSLKRLISTCNAAVRVRRSSDSTEQDIGFSGDALDTVSLLAFTGAGSGFVVKWYDQTGNGYHQIQTAATTKQPRIVNAGVYDAAIVPDGTDDFLSCASIAGGTTWTAVYTKINITSFATYRYIFDYGNSAVSGTAGWVGIYTVASLNKIIGYYGAAGSNYNSNQKADTVGMRQRTYFIDRSLANTAELKLYSAGIDLGYTNDGNGGNITVNGVTSAVCTLMAGAQGASQFSVFPHETIAYYDADTTALRTTIEAML